MEIRKYGDSVSILGGINITYAQAINQGFILPYNMYKNDPYAHEWMQPQPTYAERIAIDEIQPYAKAIDPTQWDYQITPVDPPRPPEGGDRPQ